MDKLSEKQVKHVANLARLDVSDEKMEHYCYQLADILTEIDKILSVDIKTDELLIAPTNNCNKYSADEVCDMLKKADIFKNANNVSDDYIVVPRVIDND